MWSDVETKTVDKLPFDIDGLVKYQLKFDKERRMESSRDGRTWAGFMTSRRSGFTGTRRLARCKGSYKCINDDCAYLKQYFKRNRVQFQVRSGENICHSCGAPAIHIQCPASKVWEFDDSNGTVVVYHHGVHTCVPMPSGLCLKRSRMMQLPSLRRPKNLALELMQAVKLSRL